MQYLAIPLTGCDVSAFMQAVLALSFLSVWLKDHEPGLLWLAAGYVILASSVFMPEQRTGDLYHVQARWWVGVNLLGMMAVLVGVMGHLRLLGRANHFRMLGLLVVPLVVMVCYLGVGWSLPRWVVIWGVTFAAVLLGVMCFITAHKEGVNGHAGAGVALFAVPVMCWLAEHAQSEQAVFQTWVVLPALPLGLSLLISTLQRRRRALELAIGLRVQAEGNLRKLNSSLEEQVSQRTADLQRMLSGLESFNRSVSHDLRGPLGSMASLARMANKALGQGDVSLVQRVLPDMAKQAEALHRMVNALLELARVSDLHFKKRTVDLQQMVAQVVAELALANPGWPVKQAVKVGTLPQVLTDSDMLIPVFVNLIGNALKFAKPDTQPQVEVGALDQALHEVTLFVRDHGLGFDEARMADLFKPFTRLHGNVVEGHGVGLSIVSRAVERLGGRVWARSTPGQGACFYFTLPKLA